MDEAKSNLLAAPRTSIADSQRNPSRKLKAFTRGFANGFGCVGNVFDADRKGSSHWLNELNEKSVSQRHALINDAKVEIVTRYVGRVSAGKLCSVVSTSNRYASLRANDRLEISGDFANAMLKLHV